MTALLPGYTSETGYLYRRQPYPLSIEQLGRVYNQAATVPSERYGNRPMYSPTDNYGSAYGYSDSPGSNEADLLHAPSTMPATQYPPTSPYSPTIRDFPQCPTFSVPRVSESGMIVVRGYTPSEGEPNIPITVEVELHPDDNDEGSFGHRMPTDNLKLRLVLGCTAVKTTILRSLPKSKEDETEIDKGILRLRLHGSAPLYSETLCDKPDVPLTIQAMDGITDVVESFTFGTFTYWTGAGTVAPLNTIDPSLADGSLSPELKRKRDEEEADSASRFAHHMPPPSPTKRTMKSAARVDASFKLVRTTNASDQDRAMAEAHIAEFEWVSGNGKPHPKDLDQNWSDQEIEAGRRLIRFSRGRSGNKLLVSCEVIPQESYDDDDIVISCVYRQEQGTCWFTSVDIIYLLERLAGTPFSVEEKNRIRRNLEGLKPTTVSKNRRGYEHFFQRIMDFPPPKPRNIEKDVKVFPWSALTEALKKIISKYSLISSDASDSTPSHGSSSPSWSGHSPTTSATRSLSHSSLNGSAPQGLRMPPSSLSPLVESRYDSTGMRIKSEGPVLTPNIEQPPPFPHPLAPNFNQFAHARHRSGSVASSTATTSNPNSGNIGAPDEYTGYDMGSYVDPHHHHHAHGAHVQGYTTSPTSLHLQAFSNPYASSVSLASPVNAEFGNLSLGTHSPTTLHGLDPSLGGDIFKYDTPDSAVRRDNQTGEHLLYSSLSDPSPKVDQDAFEGTMYPHFSSSGNVLLRESSSEHQ